MSFCHLHVHNEFSLLDGFGRAEHYAKEAKEKGFKYIALTNHGNIDGLIKWQKACDKFGVVPIFGVECYIVEDYTVKEKGEKRGHITLLIKNEQGFRNVCKLLTTANIEGFYYRPRIDCDLLLQHLDGLVVMTACISSFIGKDWGARLFEDIHDEIGGDLYVEVMPHNAEEQVEINKLAKAFYDEYGVSMVATNDCHYVKRHQWESQEVLLALNRKDTWDNPERFKFPFNGLHLRTEVEMRKAFKKQGCLSKSAYSRAIKNTMRVAKKCSNFRIEKRAIRLPKIDVGMDHAEYIRRLCERKIRSMPISRRGRFIYRARYMRELDLIKRKGFESYFVLFRKLIEYCDREGIWRGPGRGSVGCSLVAYLLDITNIDSLKYKLPIDRFISEDRIDYPDIDMDFEDNKTDLVRSYLEEEFEEERVFGVSTFSKMKGRAVVRDVSRVFGVPLSEVDEFAKSVDEVSKQEKGSFDSVSRAANEDIGRDFKKRYPRVVKNAIELEGQTRHASQHAAAIIVAAEDPTNNSVGVLRNGVLMCNWDMDDVEYMGFVKLDILKLNTMTILHEASNLIKENKDEEIDLKHLKFDDDSVYAELNKGNVTGCFQVSGWSTKKVAMNIEVENFQQLSDAIALSRPGPKDSGMTDEYVRRRHGGKWKSKHHLFEKETRSTYGVVVYQEQVMGILRSVAGMSYSDADRIRKVIGKKRSKKEFAPFKQQFILGALKRRTFTRKEAEDFWSGLENHSRYSFNLAHSIGYSMVAYWDLYLKVHYPLEFICASLTYGPDDKDKKEELIEDAKRMGLKIMPPKVGISKFRQWVVNGDGLYVPFIEIDGIGQKSEGLIEEASDNSTSQMGLWGEIEQELSGKAKRVRGILEKVGAFDELAVPEDIEKYVSYDFWQNPVKINKIRFKVNKRLLKCKSCPLWRECTLPVQPSPGKYNVMVGGEAPGFNEDKVGKGFVGRAGDLLWEKLSEYGLKRGMFHITNCNKCYPKSSKTPSHEEVNICFKKWMRGEIESIVCGLMLAFGNTLRYALTGKMSGIRAMSGSTELIDFEYGKLKVVWCVHPASVLRGDEENKLAFEKGLKKFVEELRIAQGFDEVMF